MSHCHSRALSQVAEREGNQGLKNGRNKSRVFRGWRIRKLTWPPETTNERDGEKLHPRRALKSARLAGNRRLTNRTSARPRRVALRRVPVKVRSASPERTNGWGYYMAHKLIRTRDELLRDAADVSGATLRHVHAAVDTDR